jgi:CheY-like chemotaxis protein
MSQSTRNPDLLASVAQHVHAGNRLMARLELDPQMSVLGNQASSWLWQAWLAESPGTARSALQKAQKLDQDNELIAAGLTFVQGLLDLQPNDVETDFDVDPEFLVNPFGAPPNAPGKAGYDVETDFDVDPEFLIEPVEDAQVARPEARTDVVACADTESIDEFESQQPAAPQARSSDGNSPNLLVLAVDDSRTVRELVSLTLSTAGYEVMTAANGAEALHKIENRRPALVLTEITMPKLDGYKLCKLIKKHQHTHDIPVVMLSENDGVLGKLRRSMVGCRDHVVKPFKSKDLLEKVRDHALVRRESEQSVDA